MVKWPLLRALVLAGLGMASAGAQNGTVPIVIDYPADGSVFPPDMVAPTFLWRDSAPSAVSWGVIVGNSNGGVGSLNLQGGTSFSPQEIDHLEIGAATGSTGIVWVTGG